MAPTWRQLFDTWEKTAGPALESTTASPAFRDLLALSAKVTSTVMTEAEKSSRRWLHLWNLPAASDVRHLRRQVSTLNTEVVSLRRSLQAATEELTARRLLDAEAFESSETIESSNAN
jgi:hypothetical protein